MSVICSSITLKVSFITGLSCPWAWDFAVSVTLFGWIGIVEFEIGGGTTNSVSLGVVVKGDVMFEESKISDALTCRLACGVLSFSGVGADI
jgi:hypothetical protein